VGVVFVGTTEVGGVADDEIAIWDASSADGTAVDGAAGAIRNAENDSHMYVTNFIANRRTGRDLEGVLT
jgi:hypothetical protein